MSDHTAKHRLTLIVDGDGLLASFLQKKGGTTFHPEVTIATEMLPAVYAWARLDRDSSAPCPRGTAEMIGPNVLPKRILVVDDDPGMQELLRVALEAEGYDVTVARDGVEALEYLEGGLPDLVVLDLMMPRMDGYGFTIEVQRRGLRDRLMIMVLSADTRGLERARAIEADAYLDKPFNLPEFLDQVAELAA